MKTIEEKAKAYDEALEQAKKELATCGSLDCDAARQIFRFFPQLRKSENDRMLELCIWFLDQSKKYYAEDSPIKDCIKWLERQKEQKVSRLHPEDYPMTPGECIKPAWNEKDTLMLTATIQTLERFGGRGTTGMQIDWLKSLPERFNLQPKTSWKPSEEQMAVLLNAEGLERANDYKDNARILAELYVELKKL